MIERILYNGHIVTLDDKHPRVTALAINGDRIIVAGTDDDILNLATANTTRQNLNGKFVIPGLTDAHLHWEWLTHSLHQVDLYEVPSKAEAIRRVAEHASNLDADQWVLGRGWSQDLWTDGAFPTAADLDPVTGGRPAYFQAKSGHAGWANTRALQIAGITADTSDPSGGHVLKGADGQPTGVLLETAMDLVADCLPILTPEDLATEMRLTQQRALATGLTGFHDFDDPSCLRALQIMRERGELGMRVVKQINQDWFDHALELGLRWGFGDDWIRLGGLKLFADGALGPRTAYMVEPYEGEPDNYGMTVVGKEDMYELISRASAAGFPGTIHAIGDRAVHDVLDVYEAVRREEAARGEKREQRRHRIEHVQIIHPDDKHRLAELDIIASMQPVHGSSDWERAEKYWGDRCIWAYNPRLQIDQGVRVAFGSDAPVEPFRPLEGMYSAVARRQPNGTPGPEGWYPELRLTVDETLRGFTQGPAYAAGMEDRLGQLSAGYLADLVVLDRDLYTIEPEELLVTQVIATMVGGVWRHGGIE